MRSYSHPRWSQMLGKAIGDLGRRANVRRPHAALSAAPWRPAALTVMLSEVEISDTGQGGEQHFQEQ